MAYARVQTDVMGPITMFQLLTAPGVMSELQAAVGRAAHRVAGDMKDQLNTMIYNKPEPTNYKRTHRLYNGAHAAKPGKNHDGDDRRALSGDMDKENRNPQDVVQERAGVFTSEIGDWVSYAYFVHEGLGAGLREVRPFSVQPRMNAPKYLNEEVNLALAVAIRGIVG